MKKLALGAVAAGLLLLGIGCAPTAKETTAPAAAPAPPLSGATNVNAATGGTNTNTSAPSTGATAPLPANQGGDINGPIGPGPGGF